MISVLIPWREPRARTCDEVHPEQDVFHPDPDAHPSDRKLIFDWVLARCRALLPEAGISVADSGHEEFNRGASINLAASEAKGDVFLISDADTFFHADQIREAVMQAVIAETWVLPYETYINIDAASTARLLSAAPTVEVGPDEVSADHRLVDSVSGLIVLTKQAFGKSGGFDEHFRSWGYEDRAFESAANTLVGPCRRLPGACFHLDHEPTQRFEQPFIEHNRALASEYQKVTGQQNAMRRLVNR